MRINAFIAQASSLSRRAADAAIQQGRVQINGKAATIGTDVSPRDNVTLDGHALDLPQKTTTIMLHKPRGYVCSRRGQGSETIYELLPGQYQRLNPIGRLDKDSSGLLLLTDDGTLAHQLTHPRYMKDKLYEITLDKPLTESDESKLTDGILLEDGKSALKLRMLGSSRNMWQVTLHEGRNRQIRRTFAALGYTVVSLHRTSFGEYSLGSLRPGNWQTVAPSTQQVV